MRLYKKNYEMEIMRDKNSDFTSINRCRYIFLYSRQVQVLEQDLV